MPTIQLIPTTATINGTKYTQLILTPVSPRHKQSKNILPKQEPLSPSSNGHTSEKKVEGQKGRIHFSKKALTHPRPQSIMRRNTRERNRVRAVNQGFVTLANHVPSHLRSKKMSKVDTLKAAIDYIYRLKEALESNNPEEIYNNGDWSESVVSSSYSSPQSPSSIETCQILSFSSTTSHTQRNNLLQNENPYHMACTSPIQEFSFPPSNLPESQNFQTGSYHYAEQFFSGETFYSPFQAIETSPSHPDYTYSQVLPSHPNIHIDMFETQRDNLSSLPVLNGQASPHPLVSRTEADILDLVSSWLSQSTDTPNCMY
ncbi:achaete-scute complex protein T4-like [Watersipora subatra]|uniref:achaete-scute complex protein T4-like n=1 Tax=Watersipora subatra TaxID=2589382 RepID=UPI00355B7168